MIDDFVDDDDDDLTNMFAMFRSRCVYFVAAIIDYGCLDAFR